MPVSSTATPTSLPSIFWLAQIVVAFVVCVNTAEPGGVVVLEPGPELLEPLPEEPESAITTGTFGVTTRSGSAWRPTSWSGVTVATTALAASISVATSPAASTLRWIRFVNAARFRALMFVASASPTADASYLSGRSAALTITVTGWLIAGPGVTGVALAALDSTGDAMSIPVSATTPAAAPMRLWAHSMPRGVVVRPRDAGASPCAPPNRVFPRTGNLLLSDGPARARRFHDPDAGFATRSLPARRP